MRPKVEFFLEFSSSYSYLAATRIGEICRRHGADLEWKPILLGPILRATKRQPTYEPAAQAEYLRRDVERCARRLGVPFRFSSHFPLNSLSAARGFHLARERKKEEAYVLEVFRVCWVEGMDPAREETLRGVAAACGLDGEELIRRTKDPEVKAWLHREVDDALARGIFGSPIAVFQGEMFYGQDRLDLLEEALQRSYVEEQRETLLGRPPTPFNELLGSHCIHWEKGRTRYELAVSEQHQNRRGVAHGGVAASLLDTALGAAVVSSISKEEWCGTLEMSIQYREPILPGTITAEGRLVRRGRTAAFAEGELKDEGGRILATAHGVWTIWPSRPR